MKSLILAFVLSLFCTFVFAHEDDELVPEPINPEQSEQLHSCLVQAARAAWGADARFHDAPRIFKRVPMDEVYAMMTGKDAAGKFKAIPNDGIYIAEELGLGTDYVAYTKAAGMGWDQADDWAKAGRKPINRSIMVAIFADGCKKATMPQKKKSKDY
jgi:hypothetical protein